MAAEIEAKLIWKGEESWSLARRLDSESRIVVVRIVVSAVGKGEPQSGQCGECGIVTRKESPGFLVVWRLPTDWLSDDGEFFCSFWVWVGERDSFWVILVRFPDSSAGDFKFSSFVAAPAVDVDGEVWAFGQEAGELVRGHG